MAVSFTVDFAEHRTARRETAFHAVYMGMAARLLKERLRIDKGLWKSGKIRRFLEGWWHAVC
jgi:hypothetical protein